VTQSSPTRTRITAVVAFLLALLFWSATITRNSLGFILPSNAQTLGADIWVALVWLAFLYATWNLSRVFRKRMG
jgi:hypothetical protein